MAKQSNYYVSAFFNSGRVICRELVSTKVSAGKLAREFLGYSNVYTVDVNATTYGDYGAIIDRYIKMSAHTGFKVDANGKMANIRF